MKNKTISAKKILSVLLAALMLVFFVPSAMAAPKIGTAKATVLADKLTVDGEMTGASSTAHILVLMTGARVTPAYEVEDDGNAGNDIYALGYGTNVVGDKGAATFSVDTLIPDSVPTGTYLVTVGSSDSDTTYKISLKYVGAADRAAAMAVYYNEDTTAEELITALDKVDGLVGASGSDETIYNSLGDEGKEKYAELMLSYRSRVDEGEETIETFGELSNEALVVAAVTTAATSAQYQNAFNAVNKYAELIGLDVADDRFLMISQADNFVKTLVAQNPEIAAADDISEALNSTLYFARLNETSTLAYAEYIKENNGFFGVPKTELSAVMSSTKMLTYFCQAMRSGLPVYSMTEFSELWETAYAKAQSDYKNNQSSNTGSGGSGSGSSKNNTTGTSVSVNPNLVGSDPLGKKKLVTDYYDDVTGYEWAHSAILSLTEDNILSGTGNNKFEPARALKREEFMKLLVNTFNLADMTATSSFTDVSDRDAWYYMYIASAEKAGVTSGRGDGTFGIGDDVTREEMATLVYRAAVASGVKLPLYTQSVINYSDVDTLSAYAIEAVKALTDNGIMSGSDGKFSPKDSASRAQAAVVINNIRNYTK